jgi:hypothetical protein
MRALAAAVTILLGGCASGVWPSLGWFASVGGLLGTWDEVANFCASGIESGAFGRNTVVWFSHRSGRSHAYQLSTGALDGKLTMVAVERGAPFRRVELRSDRCARFEVHQVPAADGTLGADVELDCETDDHGRVTASLHAASCR